MDGKKDLAEIRHEVVYGGQAISITNVEGSSILTRPSHIFGDTEQFRP